MRFTIMVVWEKYRNSIWWAITLVVVGLELVGDGSCGVYVYEQKR